MGMGFLLGVIEDVLKLNAVMVAQLRMHNKPDLYTDLCGFTVRYVKAITIKLKRRMYLQSQRPV